VLPTTLPVTTMGTPMLQPVAENVPEAQPGAATSVKLTVAPVPSGVVVFNIDSTGSLIDTRIAASSQSGQMDTAVVAALRAAAADHAIPRPPPGQSKVRYDLAFTTASPAGAGHYIPLGKIQSPIWALRRPAGLDLAAAPDWRPPGGTAAGVPARDSTMLEVVIGTDGRPVLSTARILGGAPEGVDQGAYRVFVSRVVRLLPETKFIPALVGDCPVPALVQQGFAYH